MVLSNEDLRNIERSFEDKLEDIDEKIERALDKLEDIDERLKEIEEKLEE